MSNKKHYRTCNLCEAMCGLEIEHNDSEIITIKGDKLDPFSEGHICPKAVALKDIYEDKDRLRHPVKRTESGWKKISWKEAYSEVSSKLVQIQRAHGDSAVGIYQGNPVVHNTGTMLTAPDFVRALKTHNRYSATSVDQLPHHFASYLMFGHQLMLPVPDIDRTDFLVIMGANPIVSNGSLMTAPNVKKRFEKIQRRGGKIVNIDPRFTETSAKSDQHIYIKPGCDVYFLAALVYVLFEENLIKPIELPHQSDDLEKLKDVVQPYSPETISGIAGIAPEAIRVLARQFSEAERAVLYGRLGVCTQEFGGLCMWLVNVINIITGNCDQPGGAMFPSPAIDVKPYSSKGHIGRWSSRARNIPEFGSELPVSTLAEDILTEGEGRIKAMIINAGNPVLSTPNGTQLKKAFESLDFMVSIDIYINETSSLADIILPPATGLEVDHYDLVFHSLAVRNTVKYSKALFKPAKNARYDWQIFRALRKNYLKQKGRYTLKERVKALTEKFMSVQKMIALGIKRGPYGKSVGMKDILSNPHGLDLGALKPQLPRALYTKDRTINLFPKEMQEDFKRVHERLASHTSKDEQFLLIGRRQLRTCNSWLHNSQRMVKSNDCVLYIHPEDARKVGLNGNQKATVTSRVGSITLPYELTDGIIQGTVSVPHGWGHHGEISMTVAAQNPGQSINDLTDDVFMDQLTGNAALNGVPVDVVPA